MRGLLQVDEYTIVIDKINFWETQEYNRTFYLTIYLDNGESIQIKKDTKEEIFEIEKHLSTSFGY